MDPTARKMIIWNFEFKFKKNLISLEHLIIHTANHKSLVKYNFFIVL